MLRRLATPILVLGVTLAAASPAGPARAAGGAPRDAAAPAAPAGPRVTVAVVKVSGLIDPINADLLARAVRDAARNGTAVLVVQMNSTGGTIGRARLDRLAAAVRSSPVPVAVWVGGSGRPRAYGPAFSLLRAAAYRAVGPGARVGRDAGTPSLGATDALTAKVVEAASPTLGDFIVGLDGRTLVAGGAPLHLAEVVTVGGQSRREIAKNVDVAFSQLTVFPRILHSAASPNVAFVMLVLALCLAVFEFYTAGVGVAAATAVLFGVLAAYGLGSLPTRPWAVVLIAAGVFGFAIDVQSGAPRAWTGIGTVCTVIGSLWLYRGHAVSPWVLVVVGVLLLLFMVSGMPAMVRTRFSTPTIGREAMIGSLGLALSGVDPDGTVEVNGAPWRARTNRATPIPAGGAVRVTAIDGLVLEVEPEAGGARDYRH